MDLSELEELEDIEDDFIEEYKRKRINELKQQAVKERFGTVEEISKSEYAQKVTEQSITVWVVVLLYQNHVLASKTMLAMLERLARKYKATRFIKMQADLCIEKYPDRYPVYFI